MTYWWSSLVNKVLSKTTNEVRIVEVGPRDGLQNEQAQIPTQMKIRFIQSLIDSGVKRIELSSFVSPKAVPQMSDVLDIYKEFKSQQSLLDLICLVPNQKGMELAQKSQVNSIALFTSTSDLFNKKNINMSVDDSLLVIEKLINQAKQDEMRTRGYISTVFGCPYAGQTSVDRLIKMIEQFLKWGVDEVPLGDTIGVARPSQVQKILERVKTEFGTEKIALHFHDTRGLALVNISTAYDLGYRCFDSSAGGLGGCPYAKGATGNVATEEVIRFFEDKGIETGIDLKSVVESSTEIFDFLQKKSSSKMRNAFIANGY
jgi:hydroxymethylglutaryl-CoA lyase